MQCGVNFINLFILKNFAYKILKIISTLLHEMASQQRPLVNNWYNFWSLYVWKWLFFLKWYVCQNVITCERIACKKLTCKTFTCEKLTCKNELSLGFPTLSDILWNRSSKRSTLRSLYFGIQEKSGVYPITNLYLY